MSSSDVASIAPCLTIIAAYKCGRTLVAMKAACAAVAECVGFTRLDSAVDAFATGCGFTVSQDTSLRHYAFHKNTKIAGSPPVLTGPLDDMDYGDALDGFYVVKGQPLVGRCKLRVFESRVDSAWSATERCDKLLTMFAFNSNLRPYTLGDVARYAAAPAACDASVPEQKLVCDALEDCVGFSRRKSGCAYWIMRDSNLRAYELFQNKDLVGVVPHIDFKGPFHRTNSRFGGLYAGTYMVGASHMELVWDVCGMGVLGVRVAIEIWLLCS